MSTNLQDDSNRVETTPEFSDGTIHHIELLNCVLSEIGASPIFANSDFHVDKDSLGYHSVVIYSVPREKVCIPLIIDLGGDGMRLDVYGISEAFEWNKEFIFANREKVVAFLKRILTCYVLLEWKGSPNRKSRICLFDKEGSFVGKYAIRGFFHQLSSWDYEKSLFFPWY